MRPLRHFAACLAALLLSCAAVRAASPAFDAAARNYDAGKFAEAKQGYGALVESGDYSANLFYNLGNTCFRLGDPGGAILNYERALVLDPAHPEARANLAFVREQTGAQIPRRVWLDYIKAPMDIAVFTWTAAVAAWILVFVFCLMGLAHRPNRPLLWTVAFGCLLALFFAGAGIAVFERDKALAIVTAKQSEARLEPLDNAAVAETLPPGSQVKILSDRGAWLYCSLPDAARAWVPAGSVEKVRLPRS